MLRKKNVLFQLCILHSLKRDSRTMDFYEYVVTIRDHYEAITSAGDACVEAYLHVFCSNAKINFLFIIN